MQRRKGMCPRRKAKKKANRYNPNNPDWNAVHLPWYQRYLSIRRQS